MTGHTCSVSCLAGWGEGARPPPVLQLHGRGIGPVMFDGWTGFSPLADEAGFVVAMPAAIDEVWNDGRYRGTTGANRTTSGTCSR